MANGKMANGRLASYYLWNHLIPSMLCQISLAPVSYLVIFLAISVCLLPGLRVPHAGYSLLLQWSTILEQLVRS
jgi:hypothetical protein